MRPWLKSIIVTFLFAVFSATTLYVFISDRHLRDMAAYNSGYYRGVGTCERTGAFLPKGATKGITLAKQTHPDNQ